MEQVVIIGSGPAGYTAAIYTARAALSPLLLSGMQPGGQLTTTTVIENWPGFVDGIDGTKLMQDMRGQAEKVGTRMLNSSVSKIEVTKQGTFLIKQEYEADIETKSVIIATGASALTLPLPNKDKLMGYGLSTCATCDGFFYRNKKVAIVGGGDSAMEEAMYLAKLASEVILIHRSDKFRASKSMQERVLQNPKIKIIYHTEVVDTTSNEQGLTGVVVKEKGERTYTITVDGLFMAIGHHPNTEFIKGLVELDDKGYILTNNGTHTNVPGIFAAGDVEDKIFRQAITASGRGCQAAMQVEKYVEGMEH
jgi:thioredoxin reductase (NADPH)